MDQLELSKEASELVYSDAYAMYRQGHYAKAEQLFRLLSIHHTFEPKFWMGLAGSLQMQKKYAEAVKAYNLVYALDGSAYKACFHCAECYFSLNDKKHGIKALNLAIDAIKVQATPDENMLTHIELMKQMWGSQIK